MLAVVAVGISVHGKNGVDVPAHLGQVFGVSRTVGILRKVGAKAVDIRSIHIRYIVGNRLLAGAHLVGCDLNRKILAPIRICG